MPDVTPASRNRLIVGGEYFHQRMIASEPSLLGDELRSHVPGKKPGKGRHRGKPRRAYEYDSTPHSVLAAADPGPGRHSHSRRRPSTRAFHSDADRKSTRLNSSHTVISYAVFCLKKKKK